MDGLGANRAMPAEYCGTFHDRRGQTAHQSTGRVSLPARVMSARNTGSGVVAFRNFTDPSTRSTFVPAGMPRVPIAGSGPVGLYVSYRGAAHGSSSSMAMTMIEKAVPSIILW